MLQVIPIVACDRIGIPFEITDDSMLEITEYFSIDISTTDDALDVAQGTTQVFILDNGMDYTLT